MMTAVGRFRVVNAYGDPEGTYHDSAQAAVRAADQISQMGVEAKVLLKRNGRWIDHMEFVPQEDGTVEATFVEIGITYTKPKPTVN